MTSEKLEISYMKKGPAVVPPGFQRRRTIPQMLEFISEEKPDKEAVVFASTDGQREAVTMGEIYKQSQQVAKAFLAIGIKPREIVAINLRTCPEWLCIVYGAIMADIIPLGVSFTYTDGTDMIALMDKLQTCSCLVFDPGFENEKWNILKNLLDDYDINGNVTSSRMPSLRKLLCIDPDGAVSGLKPFSDLLNLDTSNIDLPETNEDDIAVLFQTSGSTGVPKIVAHTHNSLCNMAKVDPNEPFVQGRLMNERPFSWIGGFPHSVLYGQTRVTISEFCPPPEDPIEFMLETICREDCTFLFMLPPRIPDYLKKKEAFNASPLQMIFVGGQPISHSILTKFKELCPYVLVSYGGTEILSIAVNVVADADKYVENCVGPVLENVELKIVDANEEIVPIDTIGEIYTRGPKLFKGYFNDPEKTKATFTADGWFKTDDLGRLTENGVLMIEGRKSNMIISGGLNVKPEILEVLISKCPGVQAVCLVPVPDDIMYQVICACVKVVPGSDVNEDVIRKYCEDMHADKKGSFTVIPKYYLIFDNFPETASGKVARKQLTAVALKKLKI